MHSCGIPDQQKIKALTQAPAALGMAALRVLHPVTVVKAG